MQIFPFFKINLFYIDAAYYHISSTLMILTTSTCNINVAGDFILLFILLYTVYVFVADLSGFCALSLCHWAAAHLLPRRASE